MRRLLLLGSIVCVIASIALVGSALANRGKTSRSSPPVHAALSSKALKSGKPFTVKIEVVHEKLQTLALVAVDVHGEKLAFIVDTGAAQTQVTDKIAEKLKLTKVGKPIPVTGIGCTSKAQEVKLDNWSIAGHALPASTVDASTLAIAKGKLAGLLGSDVWSKFGSIKVDYANETLTIG